MSEFQDHTITNVMPTGQTSEKFGNEYYVKFQGSPDTVKVWRSDKNKPVEGAVWNGRIDGTKFVKPPFVSGKTESGAPAKRTYGAIQADKGDGMRQGMCINNAANFVNGYLNGKGETVSPEEWAEMVHTHAQALYSLGDLKSTTTDPNVEVTDVDAGVANVKDVFGIQ